MATDPRAFISFDYDNNSLSKRMFIGQIKNLIWRPRFSWTQISAKYAVQGGRDEQEDSNTSIKFGVPHAQ